MDGLPLTVSFPRKAKRAAQAPRGDGKVISAMGLSEENESLSGLLEALLNSVTSFHQESRFIVRCCTGLGLHLLCLLIALLKSMGERN